MRVPKEILGVAALMVGLAAGACGGGGGDTVQATGGDGMEDGVLADGTAGGTARVDDRATGPDGSQISVGLYDAGGETRSRLQSGAPQPSRLPSR
jgi:hypothetical protein